MTNLNDNGNVLVTGHVLIKDTETKEVLVNTRGQKNHEPGPAYVYMWLNPLKDNQPFYIGKGIEDRAEKHLLEHDKETVETAVNKRKFHTLKKIKEAGKEPIIKYYVKNIDEDLAYTVETSLIKKYGRKGIDEDGILDNIMLEHFHPPGGKKGMKHKYPRSDEYRKQASKRQTGTHWSDEQRSRRSGLGNPMYGKTVGEETKAIWREQRSGENNPMYGKTGEDHPIFGHKHTEAECQNRSKRMSKDWELTWPDGKVETIFNLKHFCNVNNLNYYMVYNSRNGFRLKEIK